MNPVQLGSTARLHATFYSHKTGGFHTAEVTRVRLPAI
ncbi:unnamed protein product [Musa acuminata subsp. burmannicoides]